MIDTDFVKTMSIVFIFGGAMMSIVFLGFAFVVKEKLKELKEQIDQLKQNEANRFVHLTAVPPHKPIIGVLEDDWRNMRHISPADCEVETVLLKNKGVKK